MRLKEFKLAIDELKPYKRPVSLASPSIILDEAGDVKMVFGAAGGKYIATALAQVSEYQSFIYNYYAASLSAKILCFLYSFACFFVLSISSNFLLFSSSLTLISIFGAERQERDNLTDLSLEN